MDTSNSILQIYDKRMAYPIITIMNRDVEMENCLRFVCKVVLCWCISIWITKFCVDEVWPHIQNSRNVLITISLVTKQNCYKIKTNEKSKDMFFDTQFQYFSLLLCQAIYYSFRKQEGEGKIKTNNCKNWFLRHLQ